MANIKISELTALTPPDAADLVPVTDSSASQTKRTTVGEIVGIINGDVDVADDGTATISELPVSKLQDGDARQLLQTDAAGTGVEWTSNVDVPGTLDVTGAATLDSTLGVTGQSTLASAAVSDLTSGRVVLAGTSGELEDNAKLTFNGTQLDVDGNVVITGDLTVEGASTILETETVKVEDKNIELGVVTSPTDVTADGGGITLKGTTDKTINWVDATDAWTSSERFSVPLGTAAAPSLTFTGDPNTGIYSPGADQVAISTNGTGRLFVNSSGDVRTPNSFNVGDATALSVFGARAATNGNIYFRDINSLTAGTGVAIDVLNDSLTTVQDLAIRGATTVFRNATSETLRITSTGLVGIGTSSPGALLDARGTGVVCNIGTASNFTQLGTFGTGTTERPYLRLTDGAGGYHVSLGGKSSSGTQSSSYFLGQVGIGTTIASSLLHLYSSSAGGVRLTIQDSGTGTTSSDGYIQGVDSSQNGYFFNRESAALYFGTANTERARIDSSGRLLVGTSSAFPAANITPQFQVGGTTDIAATALVFNNANTANPSQLLFGKARGGGGGTWVSVLNNDVIGRIAFSGADNAGDINTASARIECAAEKNFGINDSPGRLVFSTTADGAISPTERMRIDSSGRVGVGTTSASSLLSLGTSLANYKLKLYDGGDANDYGFGVQAGVLYYQSGGAHLFNVGGTERARIDSSGRLLVGTSTSRVTVAGGQARLQIEGVGTDTAGLSIVRTSDDAGNPTITLGNTRNGSAVQSGDGLGAIFWVGDDGTDLATAACSIKAEVDGTPGANDMPGRLVFSVTADGASSPTEALRISNDRSITVSDGGNIVVGTTTGTKIGTATSQKIGFFDATPVVQPTTGVTEAAFVENSGGTAVNVDSTFGGYTLQQVVQALQNLGILA